MSDIDPKKFEKALWEEARQKNSQESRDEEIRKRLQRRMKKPFPLGKVMIGIAAIVVVSFNLDYFLYLPYVHSTALSVLTNPNVNKFITNSTSESVKSSIQDFISKSSEKGNAQSPPTSMANGVSTITSPVSDSKSAQNIPTTQATAEEIKNNDFVSIEGKYYKYSPDNVYLINGRRVYYVDKLRRNNKSNSNQLPEKNNSED